jgi:hypothetical protein
VSGAQGTQGLVARLPLLGPVLGWTRRDPQDAAALLTRVWVKADDSDSQPAVLALSARWNGGVLSGSVRLWRVCAAEMTGAEPPAEERFALADIACRQGEGGILRIVTIHLTLDVGPSSGGVPFRVPGVDLFKLAGEFAAAQQLGAGERLPQPQEIDFTEVFPGESDLTLEKFAADLFRDLEGRIAAERVPRPSGGTRPLPKQRAGRIELCEALLRPDRCAGPRLAFAAGCCRHPGLDFDRDLADRALSALARRAAEDDGPELVLMLGDQIYADATAGVIDAEDRLEKYTARYCDAFQSAGFRRLARRAPLYMVGDDHEIRDNWPKAAVPPGAAEDVKRLVARSDEWARLLFIVNQRSHGPDFPAWAPRPGGKRLWYAFDAGALPFFCFDTRFERSADGQQLMHADQLEGFRAWLDRVCGRDETRSAPKFILSGSVFAPLEAEFAGRPQYARRGDSWAGYPRERELVMRELVGRSVQNAVFVSGDYHCAAVASLRCSGSAAALRCYSVVAPPFYAPFPFANMPAQAVAKRERFATVDRDGREVEVTCRAEAFDAAGFAVLRAEPPAPGADPLDWQIRVEYHADGWDDNGRLVTRATRTARLARGEFELLRPRADR